MFNWDNKRGFQDGSSAKNRGHELVIHWNDLFIAWMVLFWFDLSCVIMPRINKCVPQCSNKHTFTFAVQSKISHRLTKEKTSG